MIRASLRTRIRSVAIIHKFLKYFLLSSVDSRTILKVLEERINKLVTCCLADLKRNRSENRCYKEPKKSEKFRYSFTVIIRLLQGFIVTSR